MIKHGWVCRAHPRRSNVAFLSILRTTEERCEQCDATEHVLRIVVSEGEEDNIRLTACVICVVVAMDNAMEWRMSRQFAQALANRAAGEQVQAEAKRQKDAYDRRIKETESRARARVPADSGTGGDSSVLPLGIADTRRGAEPMETARRGNKPRGNESANRKRR